MFSSSMHTAWFEELDHILAESKPKPVDTEFFRNVANRLSVFDVPNGIIAEFGVGDGTSINQIAEAFSWTTVWGFDSFDGLPEDWNVTHPAGSFKQDTIPQVRGNVKLVQGLFQDTLNESWEAFDQPVAFCHIDCDLFSSTMTIVDWLWTRVREDTIILFDELYYTYDGRNYLDHEYKALLELVGRLRSRNLTLKFYGQRHTEAFAFRVCKL